MSDAPSVQALIDALPEAAFVVAADGAVRLANRAARRLVGGKRAGTGAVAEFAAADRDGLAAFLRRAAGSTSPIIGGALLRDARGREVRMRLYGARLAGEGPPLLLLRCVPAARDEFSVLARKVRELNREIAGHRQAKARLEESLASNETLLRELHHRVKNNLQLTMSLFAAARRETDSAEVRAFIDGAMSRLAAVGAAQRIMRDVQSIETVPADELIRTLCEAVLTVGTRPLALTFDVPPLRIGSKKAFPLALIVNELLTNVLKHGGSAVRVALAPAANGWALSVADDGPGFGGAAPGARRASGLGLIRGLCRQIGGGLELAEREGETVVTVRFGLEDGTEQAEVACTG